MEYTSNRDLTSSVTSGYQTCDSSRCPSISQCPHPYQKGKGKRKRSDEVSDELQCQHPNILISSSVNDIPVKKRKKRGK